MNCKAVFSIIILMLVNKNAFSQINGSIINLSEIALSQNPVINRNNISTKTAEADIQMQHGIFDYNLFGNTSYQNSRYRLFNSDSRNQFINKILNTNNLDINAGIQQRLRTSQIIEFAINFTYNDTNLPYNSFSQQINPFIGDYTGTFNFTLTQPLLKGRGRNITTINERVSNLNLDIINSQNIYSASNEILQVGNAYWSYYTAYKSLEIYKQNEARVRNVLNMTEELVKADKKPAGDLLQIKADLANQEKLTIQAKQNLNNVKTNLAIAVGINEDKAQLIDNPIDTYPTIQESGYNENLVLEDYLEIAKQNRTDLIGLEKSIEALELQAELSKNNLKPTLDLAGFAFYGNSSQGNGKSFQTTSLFKTEGQYIGGGAKLTFNFAPNNNYAKGYYAKDLMVLEDQKIINSNIKRTLELNIANALYELSQNALALLRSKDAFETYRLAFENEQAKYQTGLTTLLNVILFQERLTSAELEYLRSQQLYATAIIKLRHETGTLITSDNKKLSITNNSFYTIPNTLTSKSN